jgi:type II pantothenate kinase
LIGVDVGITNTEVVIVSKGRARNSIGAPSKKGVARKLLSLVSKDEAVAITGAGAKTESALLKEREIVHVDEMGAIGIGASSLTGLDRCVVASIGTGTAIVYVDKKKCFHLGGTGVGGGTLVGLGRKLLRLEDAERIAGLAEMGNLRRVNITVGDVYGHGVGIVPADATAANFAKMGKAKREDVARGIISLVGETAGVLACFAAREKRVENIVFVGRVPTMPVMQDVLYRTAGMFGFKAIIPEQARFSTAFGAALCRQYNIYIRRNP